MLYKIKPEIKDSALITLDLVFDEELDTIDGHDNGLTLHTLPCTKLYWGSSNDCDPMAIRNMFGNARPNTLHGMDDTSVNTFARNVYNMLSAVANTPLEGYGGKYIENITKVTDWTNANLSCINDCCLKVTGALVNKLQNKLVAAGKLLNTKPVESSYSALIVVKGSKIYVSTNLAPSALPVTNGNYIPGKVVKTVCGYDVNEISDYNFYLLSDVASSNRSTVGNDISVICNFPPLMTPRCTDVEYRDRFGVALARLGSIGRYAKASGTTLFVTPDVSLADDYIKYLQAMSLQLPSMITAMECVQLLDIIGYAYPEVHIDEQTYHGITLHQILAIMNGCSIMEVSGDLIPHDVRISYTHGSFSGEPTVKITSNNKTASVKVLKPVPATLELGAEYIRFIEYIREINNNAGVLYDASTYRQAVQPNIQFNPVINTMMLESMGLYFIHSEASYAIRSLLQE